MSGGSDVKKKKKKKKKTPPANARVLTWIWPVGWEDTLKEMNTSILAWEIPWTEESGRL